MNAGVSQHPRYVVQGPRLSVFFPDSLWGLFSLV